MLAQEHSPKLGIQFTQSQTYGTLPVGTGVVLLVRAYSSSLSFLFLFFHALVVTPHIELCTVVKDHK